MFTLTSVYAGLSMSILDSSSVFNVFILSQRTSKDDPVMTLGFDVDDLKLVDLLTELRGQTVRPTKTRASSRLYLKFRSEEIRSTSMRLLR